LHRAIESSNWGGERDNVREFAQAPGDGWRSERDMTTDLPLRGVPAVVTGASRGIGSLIAARLAATGAPVAVVYRSDDAAAAEWSRRSTPKGGTL